MKKNPIIAESGTEKSKTSDEDFPVVGIGVLHLLEPVVRKGIRHPIDFFLRSLADDKREKSICIILSGTGTEGTLGLKAVKGEDGIVMVQDVKSAAKQMNEHVTDLEHELKSANEELQSANEELEASREELQSINEELMTLNAEHNNKLEEVSVVINDMNNLLVSTQIATIFLDNDLHIKGFTPAVTRIINLIETDIGRLVSDIVTNLIYENFVRDVRGVIDTLTLKEIEIKDKNNLWYFMRILPYRTTENIIDGAVITFIDITSRKQIEQTERKMMLNARRIYQEERGKEMILLAIEDITERAGKG